ncbi:transglycosylase SLT domain-containing protein [Methylocella sp.]|uniref:lytic transglycosylase domain-containing protein n=1 Tax=Methylocella sp. TaxID=1978226 RepID=UPI003784157E
MTKKRFALPEPGGEAAFGSFVSLRAAPARAALFATAAVLGFSAAYLHEKGAPVDLARLPLELGRLFSTEQARQGSAPFLAERDDPDEDAARRAGLAPTPSRPADAASAPVTAPRDLAGFRAALDLYKSGALAAGDAAAAAVKDPVVRAALEWAALRLYPRESGFERVTGFAAAHPDWPAQDWLRRRAEEALYGDRRSAELIKGFFAGEPPRTPAGRLALARALREDGENGKAAALVKDVWRNFDLTAAFETRVRTEFGAFLDRADHKFRADRLAYKEKTADALRAAALAGPDVVALIKARAAVAAEAPSDKLMAAVPAALRDDPGYKFALAQKLRRAEKFDEAAAALASAPRDAGALVDGDAWWEQRRILARKLLDRGDAAAAYAIVADHAAASREMTLEAEFHAGWIALRFLNDPKRAAAHFDRLEPLAQTPMSQSRAAYWRARAAEAQGAPDADALYRKAATYPANYYGQLAREKLGMKPGLIRMPAEEALGEARNEAVEVLEVYYAAGEKALATPLAVEAARNLPDAAQTAALARVIERQKDANLSLTVGKLASQRGVPVDELAFPTYGVPGYQPLANSAERPVVLAIARQESAFNAGAVSGAGARGLMQMLASTARATAQKAGVSFDEARLTTDAAFNAQLGAAHLGDLLAAHRGSHILTFAAYNAGGGRVKQWLEAYGDPRKPGVDPVDWVERIPFTETRNYVQRVLENVAVYRAQFAAAAPMQKADATP